MPLSPAAAWRASELGAWREVGTHAGPLHLHDRGAGRPLVFAHGWLTNANLWRKVVPALAGEFRTVALDLPLGSHVRPMAKGADLSPAGVARLILGALEALDLKDAILVGNDSGGAYSQIAASIDAGRIGGLALNACETPGTPWPPHAFDGLQAAARIPTALRLGLSAFREPVTRMDDAGFGRLALKPLEVRASDTYVLPVLEDDGVLADAQAAFPSASGADVDAAAGKLIAGFDKPVALIWPAGDILFPLDAAQAYAAALPNGRFETVADSRSFTPEDQPQALAERLAAFARSL